MKADQYGTPAEQARYRFSWHTAQKGEVRCDGCTHSDITIRANGGADAVTCMFFGKTQFTSKPNGTCNQANAVVPNPLAPRIPMTEPTDLTTTPNPRELTQYDRHRTVGECKFYMNQSAEAMLEFGKRLIDLKDNEPHGEFERIIQQELGLPTRTAQIMMKATYKLMSPQLASKAQALALLGKTKLFELVAENDDDLAELADGGKLSGMTLDEIDRMTSRELKATLRKNKADALQEKQRLQKELDSKDRLLGKKNERINELQDQLDEKQDREADIDKAAVARSQYAGDMGQAATAIRTDIDTLLRSRSKALLELCEGDHHGHARLLVAQALGSVASIVRILAMDFGINPNTLPEQALEEGFGGEGAAVWRLTQAELQTKQGG